ncbi:ABC transporter permease subunit [uncultured Pseudokineococcus sp.]|uniref:ABC transporter permease subunit n=1 Tax=uncultured Pseudokineococcus sp. TaxID=1642928 RepID=UPI00262FF3AD|nr:ABC transporter permease subunit [uncultured Pseudokineococcus sp.]
MSTTRPSTSPAGTAGTGSGRVGLARVVRSEWTKLASLRSTWMLLLVFVLLGVGVATLAGWGSAQAIEATEAGTPPAGGPPGGLGREALAASILSTTSLATLLLGVLGALAVSGEYATGTMTATLTAVPRRWPVLVAKAVLLALVLAPVALVVSGLALLAGESFLPESASLGLQDDGVLAAVVAHAAAMVVTALLGLGLGALLRSTAGSITVLVVVVFLAPGLVPLFGVDWLTTASQYVPATAAGSLGVTTGEPALTTTEAVLTLVGWALVPLLAGLVLLQRRDA